MTMWPSEVEVSTYIAVLDNDVSVTRSTVQNGGVVEFTVGGPRGCGLTVSPDALKVLRDAFDSALRELEGCTVS